MRTSDLVNIYINTCFLLWWVKVSSFVLDICVILSWFTSGTALIVAICTIANTKGLFTAISMYFELGGNPRVHHLFTPNVPEWQLLFATVL